MNHTILIIEDEERIAHWVKVYFERAGFAAEVAHDGGTGLTLARELDPDLIVLDLMLPGLDGMIVCQQLRQEADTPIIMLTAKGAQRDRVDGLESGADDYIVKPFDSEELVARAKAILRRTQNRVRQSMTCGMLTVDEATQSVTMEQQSIKLSHTQFTLLTTFMRHPNQVLTRDQIITLAFNDDFDGFDRAIDTQIRRLRKKIHREGREPIQTVYGTGYKFVPEALGWSG